MKKSPCTPCPIDLLEAVRLITLDPALKFVADDLSRPGFQYMLYSDKSFWIADGENLEILFKGKEGVCLRTNDRFTSSTLIVSKETMTLQFVPYEGTVTDFVRKVIFKIKTPYMIKEFFPIRGINVADIENLKASVEVKSTFQDARSGRFYEVIDMQKIYHNAPDGTDIPADKYTFKSSLSMPYSIYDPYMQVTVFVKEIEAPL